LHGFGDGLQFGVGVSKDVEFCHADIVSAFEKC
jgi:hypothetical protein